MRYPKTGKTQCGFLCLLIVLLLWPWPAAAKQYIRLGWLNIEPEIKYQGEYADNIYLEKSNTVDDYINTLSPELNLTLKSTRLDNSIRLGYHGDFVFYMDNGDNNYQRHLPSVELNLKTPAGFYLQAKDNYLKTKDPYGSANTYGLGDTVERWNNTAALLLGYQFADRYSLELGFRDVLERYKNEKDQFQDRMDRVYGIALFYRLTGKTSVFGEFRTTQAKYDQQNDGLGSWNSSNSWDYTLTDYFIGAKFEPGGNLSGTLKLGYGKKSFENETDPYGNAYEESTGFISETTLALKLSQKSILDFHLRRSAMGSPDGDAASFIDTAAGINLSHMVVRRLMFDLDLEWINNDYQDERPGLPEKMFTTYRGAIGTTYKMREWLRFGARYEYKTRSASDARYDYAEYTCNTISVSAHLLF